MTSVTVYENRMAVGQAPGSDMGMTGGHCTRIHARAEKIIADRYPYGGLRSVLARRSPAEATPVSA
jgi:hypothetical protein